MTDLWPSVLILFLVGVVAGTVNVIAGGGSFLTLPVLIFLGLPPTVANGTNRVGILLQNIGAVWNFSRRRLTERSWIWTAAVPATLGAVAGAWLSIEIGDRAFQRVLAVAMVLATLWMLWDPLHRHSVGDSLRAGSGRQRVVLWLAFLGVGTYAGFIQAGAGFLILALTTSAGLNLVRGNALKVLIVLVLTPIALTIFALSGKVDWVIGTVLGAGTLVGSQIGVHLTVRKGHAWIKRFVTVTILIFAFKLWFSL